ncbi:MAG TPA: redoxin domain-containing protein [Smithellaceae bacterium]|nr:redoxin domain-containing protein [Smithellaceae bacterium]HRS89259.1 redoxin domain-containing protein [Smithellaceae bacterium]HRV26283.1 redoxin domain-containing protein [Smithellaceae bacterium]
MARISAGDKFSDFSLRNQKDIEINTVKFAGKKLLLSFHPLAWTDICTKQMQSLEANFETFQKLNTVALGVSVDAVPCKKAWAENIGVAKTDLLADFWPHGELASHLGIFIERFGFSERANIIIDENRTAVFVKIYPLKELPDINEIIDFLK